MPLATPVGTEHNKTSDDLITDRLIKKQLVDQVIEHLKNVIASGKYGIGAKLPTEPYLMEKLGVGRSTLREAVRVLAHNGMLEVRQGGGTYVSALPDDAEPFAHRLRCPVCARFKKCVGHWSSRSSGSRHNGAGRRT
ncbi:MAG TPA: hypothetical protein DCP92_06345 [Nitrospiraceae bacterium]|nr:hypothetical protein [Nitrospiraceae bacterium]